MGTTVESIYFQELRKGWEEMEGINLNRAKWDDYPIDYAKFLERKLAEKENLHYCSIPIHKGNTDVKSGCYKWNTRNGKTYSEDMTYLGMGKFDGSEFILTMEKEDHLKSAKNGLKID